MTITRVLNIEDTMSKHVAVRRALGKCGISDNIIDHATNAMEGLAMIDEASGWQGYAGGPEECTFQWP